MNYDPVLVEHFVKSKGLVYKDSVNSYIFDCPFPDCGKANKLYFRKVDGVFRCWVCGKKGNQAHYILSLLAGIPISEVKFELYGKGETQHKSRIDFNLNPEFEYQTSNLIDLKPIKYPYDFYDLDHPDSERGVAYLASRGVPLDIAKQYNIRYSPKQRRIIFPAEYKGIVYGWQARATFDTNLRMLNSTTNDGSGWRAKMVMFMDRVQSNHVVIAEGPFDALKCHLMGGNVCTMGKIVTAHQVSLIRRLGITKVYLALDPDAAVSTSQLVNDLTKDLECYLIEIPSKYKDLGEMSFDLALESFQNAKKVNNSRIFGYISKWTPQKLIK